MSQMQLHHHQHYEVLPYRQIDEIDDKILEANQILTSYWSFLSCLTEATDCYLTLLQFTNIIEKSRLQRKGYNEENSYNDAGH